MKSSTFWALLLVPAAALLGALAAHLWLQPASSMQSGTLLPQPREIGAFQLIGEDGQPFTQASLQGRWSLFFTGFTHCPDVCPTTLQTLKSVQAKLGDGAQKLQVVFVSVDPERDSPAVLADYVHYFDPKFRGVTGPSAELERLGAKMGFVFLKVPGATPESYTMDHSAALMLVDPAGRVAGYFTPPLKADALAADLAAVIRS